MPVPLWCFGLHGVVLSEVGGMRFGVGPCPTLCCGEGLGPMPVIIPMCYTVLTRNITRRYDLSGTARYCKLYAYGLGWRGVAWRALSGASFPGPSLSISIMHRASRIDR